MPNYGTYVDLTTLRSSLGITDTTDDAYLRTVAESVSRYIDDYCGGRHFYCLTATKYFTAQATDTLFLRSDDLLSISTSGLKTDSDGDRTYDETWATTDYDLIPYNSWPKYALETTPEGDYTFPGYRRGVEIAGLWGYGDGDSATPYALSGSTGAVATAGGTTVVASSGALLRICQTILMGTEQMYITGFATNDLTVVRAVNGTTGAVQAAGTAINIYRYPGPVVQAALLQSSRIFRRRDAPFGVTGSGELGQPIIIQRLDSDVAYPLAAYRRLSVA